MNVTTKTARAKVMLEKLFAVTKIFKDTSIEATNNIRIVSPIFLFALAKAIVGLLSGSVILLADAVHSGADAFSTATAWFGLKIAKREPTEKFRYGFYKAENITALLISGLIFFAGAEIAKQSWNKFSVEYEIGIPFVTLVWLCSTLFLCFW